ncbi:MAG: hypothetical protein IJ253_03740 [Bacteroidaceae bacterium]|nr:hypothetical protein [Bacteroidaceae bacterium]
MTGGNGIGTVARLNITVKGRLLILVRQKCVDKNNCCPCYEQQEQQF